MAGSFNSSALEEMFGETPEVFFDILEDLKSQTPKMLSDIEQAINSTNYKELEYAAHNLKGVLANFCALSSKDLVSELEVIGRQGSGAGLDSKVSSLKILMQELLSDLNSFDFKN